MESFLTQRGKPPIELQSLALRRATIADSDKVRYRVYTSATEFVAVIAENALLAVKVSGISNPYKIMRDLPTDGIAIAASKMAKMEDTLERVIMPTVQRIADRLQIEDTMPPTAQQVKNFVAMELADLQNKGRPRARILPPELLTEIIEQHHKAQEPEPEPVPPPVIDAAPAPVPAPQAESGLTAEEQIIQAPLAQSVEERIAQLADEVLPAKTEMAEDPLTALDDPILSPADVEKLLNGNA